MNNNEIRIAIAHHFGWERRKSLNAATYKWFDPKGQPAVPVWSDDPNTMDGLPDYLGDLKAMLKPHITQAEFEAGEHEQAIAIFKENESLRGWLASAHADIHKTVLVLRGVICELSRIDLRELEAEIRRLERIYGKESKL